MTPTAFGAQRESRRAQVSALQGLVDPLEPRLCAHWDKAGLGRYWSPLAKETGQWLQLGRGQLLRLVARRDHQGQKLATHISGFSPFKPASLVPRKQQGPRPSKSFAGEFSLFHPAWAGWKPFPFQGQGWVWRPGAGSAALVLSHNFYDRGLADLMFLQIPSVGTLMDAMRGVALHSPGAGRRWVSTSRIPWDGETEA